MTLMLRIFNRGGGLVSFYFLWQSSTDDSSIITTLISLLA